MPGLLSLSRAFAFWSVFADLFVEVSLPTRLPRPVWFRFRRSESVLSSGIVLLSANFLPRMSCYLVCKLDIKICSVFGFQGTGDLPLCVSLR